MINFNLFYFFRFFVKFLTYFKREKIRKKEENSYMQLTLENLVRAIDKNILNNLPAINTYIERMIALKVSLQECIIQYDSITDSAAWDDNGLLVQTGEMNTGEVRFKEYAQMHSGISEAGFLNAHTIYHRLNETDLHDAVLDCLTTIQIETIKATATGVLDAYAFFKETRFPYAFRNHIPTYDEFEEYFNTNYADVIQAIDDEVDELTLATFDIGVYNKLAIHTENPTIKELVERHRPEIEEFISDLRDSILYLQTAVNAMQTRLPNIADAEEFLEFYTAEPINVENNFPTVDLAAVVKLDPDKLQKILKKPDDIKMLRLLLGEHYRREIIDDEAIRFEPIIQHWNGK